MPTKLYNQSALAPDTGLLKSTEHEWQSIQNFRGWGNLMSRRKGCRNSQIFSSGVMGIHDLRVDDSPDSIDKIIVTLYNGDIVVLNYNEIFLSFDFLFTTGRLLLQSPDLNWWNITPNSSGIITPTVVATPSSTILTDFSIASNQLFGFQSSTVTYQMNVDQNGSLTIHTYTISGSATTYTTDQAFVTGVGPVFTDGLLVRHRVTIDNNGILDTITI